MNDEATPIVYRDIWYGIFTKETNKEFNNRHLVPFITVKQIILDLGFKILNNPFKTNSDIYDFLVSDANDNSFDLICETMKHSGIRNNEKLRVHISPSVVLNCKNKAFLFANYNTGDSIIFVVCNLKNFISKSTIKNNNSSFWIGSIDDLMHIWKDDEYSWKTKSDNIVLHGFKLEKLKLLKANDFIKKFFDDIPLKEKMIISPLSEASDSYDIEPQSVDIAEMMRKNIKELLPRNPKYRELALQRENYCCELCKKTDTFKDDNGKNYFEGHHLIMYNVHVQSRYDKSLDIPENIICLCPECHKKIHHSDDKTIKELVVKLFIKHKKLIQIYEIESLDDIFNDYIRNREEENNNG